MPHMPQIVGFSLVIMKECWTSIIDIISNFVYTGRFQLFHSSFHKSIVVLIRCFCRFLRYIGVGVSFVSPVPARFAANKGS